MFFGSIGSFASCQVCWPRCWLKHHKESLDRFVVDERRFWWSTVGAKVWAHLETKGPTAKLKGAAWTSAVYDKIMELMPQAGVSKKSTWDQLANIIRAGKAPLPTG